MTRPKRTGSASSRRERRAFSAELKQEAVRLVHERRAAGISLTQLGRELDVRPDQLRTWVRLLAPETPLALGHGTVESPEQELRRLRREIAVLRQEREFAKNWSCAAGGAIC